MTTFNELGLEDALLEAVRLRGFEKPTPIQAEMIPFLLTEKRDVTGLAQTGTGKTAAFGLPILQKIDRNNNHTQALILTPTRELGVQVSREIVGYGQTLRGLKTATIYGGASFGPQIRDLRAGAHIITATPGRLKDLLSRNIADLSHLRFLVLDEADQMLDMGFKEDLDTILKEANPQRQTLLFSATMPPEVARIASTYMVNPHEIVSGERNRGTANVTHHAFRVHAGDKYSALRRLIDVRPSMYGIIFCRTRDTTRNIAGKLAQNGYAVDALHGELSQVQRDSVMCRFRQGNPSLLVATDVAARGLDVNNLTHIIHYDLPDEMAIYNHRSGRTGRAGKEGSSLALVHLREGHKLKRIEKFLGRKIELARIPDGYEICQKRLMNLVNQVITVEVNDDAITPYLSNIREELNDLDREALLRRFLSVEFNRFLEEYGNSSDINPPPPPKRTRQDAKHIADGGNWRGGRYSGNMVRLRINLGKKQAVLPPQIIGLINLVTRTRNIGLGQIDINSEWTDIQVEFAKAEMVERKLRGYTYRGVKICVKRGRNSRDSCSPYQKNKKKHRHSGKKKWKH